MKNIIILLISLSIVFSQGIAINSDGSITRVPEESSMTTDIVIAGAIMMVYFTIMVETMNCIQPYYDGEDRGEAFVCNWSADTFYYDDYEEKYLLYEEDSEDNWIEKKMRKRYWRRRNQ